MKTKITKEDFLLMERRARREAEFSGANITLNKVHKSKKTYSRKTKYKSSYLD